MEMVNWWSRMEMMNWWANMGSTHGSQKIALRWGICKGISRSWVATVTRVLKSTEEFTNYLG